MASGLYRSYKAKALGTSIDLTSVTVNVYLMRTSAYTVNLLTHDFLDDAATRAAGPVTLGTKTVNSPEGGVFDAADAVFTAVGAGAAIDSLIINNGTPGTDATRDLIAYVDGFSVTPNGGDITISWDNGTNRIFKL